MIPCVVQRNWDSHNPSIALVGTIPIVGNDFQRNVLRNLLQIIFDIFHVSESVDIAHVIHSELHLVSKVRNSSKARQPEHG